MWWGYVRSWMKGLSRYENVEFRRFLRRYHWLCLTRGKKRAVEIVQAESRRNHAALHKSPKAPRDVLLSSE